MRSQRTFDAAIDPFRTFTSAESGRLDRSSALQGERSTLFRHDHHEGMGHFPMVENYAELRPFLLPELEVMAATSDR